MIRNSPKEGKKRERKKSMEWVGQIKSILQDNRFKLKYIVIILNISRLNTSVKRQRFFRIDYRLKPNYVMLPRHKLKYDNKNSLKIKEWKKLYSANSNQGKAGKSVLTSDKLDLKAT